MVHDDQRKLHSDGVRPPLAGALPHLARLFHGLERQRPLDAQRVGRVGSCRLQRAEHTVSDYGQRRLQHRRLQVRAEVRIRSRARRHGAEGEHGKPRSARRPHLRDQDGKPRLPARPVGMEGRRILHDGQPGGQSLLHVQNQGFPGRISVLRIHLWRRGNTEGASRERHRGCGLRPRDRRLCIPKRQLRPGRQLVVKP